MAKSIGSEFMRQTRHAYLAVPDQQRRLPAPPLAAEPENVVDDIELPAPDKAVLRIPSFPELVAQRASLRDYAQASLSLDELSFLLWCTQGVKEVFGTQGTIRTVPSAGARHALETRLLVHRVAGLKPGFYHYAALTHRLLALERRADVEDRFLRACYDQTFVVTSAVTFLWIAVPYRMTWRYGERGYRYLHLDAGHAGQNLYLGAEAMGAGACAVAAFDDEAINHLLGLDGESAFLIYLAAVGKREAG